MPYLFKLHLLSEHPLCAGSAELDAQRAAVGRWDVAPNLMELRTEEQNRANGLPASLP